MILPIENVMKKTRAVLILALTCAAPIQILAQASAPSLTFGSSSVMVSGVPPGHDVLVFSIARESRQYWVNVVQR
jgi:hypothetical protein